MRAAAYIQEMLNNTFSDLTRYSSRSSTGGNIALKGVGTELSKTIQNIRDKEQAFPIPDSATVVPLSTPDASSAMMGLAGLLIDIVPLTMNVPKEILGATNVDTPAASLYKMLTKQMQVSLSHIMNNCDAYLYNQGCIFRDLVFEIVENNEGSMILPRLSPTNGKEGHILLSKQNMGRNYSMMIKEQDTSEDARHDEFLKIVEFLQLMPEQKRAAAVPELIKLANFDEESKQSLMQLFQPSEPTPPDPMAMELQQAQIDLVKSQADDLAAGAAKKQAEAQKITASLDNATEQAYADLMKTASEIELNQAKSEQTMASIGDKIMTRMDAMESKMHDRKQEMQPILVNNDMSALAEIMQQGGNQNAGIMKALTDVLDHAMNSEKESIAMRDENNKLSGVKTVTRRRQPVE
jgi:hypothetical protein